MSTESLWNVGNLFYLGAYQSAINEAQELHHLTDNEETERDFFVYRAYVALKKYEVMYPPQNAVLYGMHVQLVQLEISSTHSTALVAVKLLAQYFADPSSKVRRGRVNGRLFDQR